MDADKFVLSCPIRINAGHARNKISVRLCDLSKILPGVNAVIAAVAIIMVELCDDESIRIVSDTPFSTVLMVAGVNARTKYFIVLGEDTPI